MGGSMKIAFVNTWTTDPVRGSGTAVAIQQLQLGLESLGHRVFPFTSRSGASARLVDRLCANLRTVPRLRRSQFDALLGFDIDGCALSRAGTGSYFLALKGVSADEARFEAPAKRLKLRFQASLEMTNARNARRALVTSRYCAGTAERAYGLKREQLAIVPECIDLSVWREMRCQVLLRSDPRPTILSVAHQYRRKDTVTLLKALFLLRQRIPDVQVRIVGIGPRLDSLRRLADDLGLGPNLRFLGAVRDRIQLMRHYFEADLFCLPSLQEGFGIVFLEAMAAGLPIVAARAGATPEVVKENQVGLLFRPGDPGELSRLLARMLGDAELRRFFSAGALQRVEEYEQNKVAKEFLKALEI